jgi:enoyl-CoA hydratase
VSNPVTLSMNDQVATLTIEREHGNALNPETVEGLAALAQQADADPKVQAIMLATKGKLFSPGLDLMELIDLDRPAMQDFLRRFNQCILSLYTLNKPMLAALHGHAVAGGCVLALTADWRILRRGALVGLNEVIVGVPFPYGVAQILRESVPARRLTEVALFGRNFRDEEALEAGLVHEVCEVADFEARCVERLTELASKDRRAFATTKRYLRSPTVERMQAGDPAHDSDFLDAWFSTETQTRIKGLVEKLKAREA